MNIAFFLDEVSQAVDNAMQWNVMSELRQALAAKHQITMLDPLKMGIGATRKALLAQNYDLLITYNKTGTNLTDPGSGRNLMGMLEKPQISWLTEHPVTFFDQYKHTNSAYRHYIFPNERHSFFAKQMGIQGSTHAMLFGSNLKTPEGAYAHRPYDICIAAQWRGPADANAFWQKMEPKQRHFFEDINVLQHLEDHGDVFTAFLAAAEHHRVSLDNKQDFALPLKALYWHARKTERIKMVQDLVSSGLKILLVGGEGWKQVLPEHSNVHFVATCSHQELTGLYMKARAVASTNCFNGANERSFDAMSCGAISIAENSPTLTRHFKDFGDIVFYPRLHAEDTVPRIVDLLKDPKASEAVAERGRQVFAGAHTWSHRAEALSSWIEQLTITPKSAKQPNDFTRSRSVATNTSDSGPVLFQSFIGRTQRQSVNASCTPFDASYNQSPHEREYRLFKDILEQGLAGERAWGLISWKFGHKTLRPASDFLAFSSKKLEQGYDCVFINPMIGNQALFANVWEQGKAAHPGMARITQQLQMQGTIDPQRLSGHGEFAFCNYFIGTSGFWNDYVRFVDEALAGLERACKSAPDLRRALHGSARYKGDHSITMQPFVIERLFSSFIASHPGLRVASHPVERDDYVLKFGHHLGNILANCHELKQEAIAVPSTHNIKIWNSYRNVIVEQGLVKAVFKMDDPTPQMIEADSAGHSSSRVLTSAAMAPKVLELA